MRYLLVLISLTSFIMLAGHAGADTIKLKSGREIDAVKCREIGDQIKCQLRSGTIIGFHKADVVEVWKDFKVGTGSQSNHSSGKERAHSQSKAADGFQFDIWQSGISVHQAIDIAQANDIPLHRAGLISANKTFNPKMCRPYADTDTRFGYKAPIFGKMAAVSFDFTPVSKRLYSLEVKFLGTGNARESEFRQQVESMLRKKYGKPFRVSNHILYQDYDWKINGNATVTLRPIGNAVVVTYRDLMLTQLTEREKLGQVRSGFTKNDKEKF